MRSSLPSQAARTRGSGNKKLLRNSRDKEKDKVCVDKENLAAATASAGSNTNKFGYRKTALRSSLPSTTGLSEHSSAVDNSGLSELHEEVYPSKWIKDCQAAITRKPKAQKFEVSKKVEEQKSITVNLKALMKASLTKIEEFKKGALQQEAQLKTSLASVKKEAEECKHALQQLQRQQNILKAEYQKYKNESATSRLETAKLSTLRECMTEQSKDLSERLAEVDGKLKDVEERLREKDAEVVRLTERAAAQEREIAEKKERYEETVKQYQSQMEATERTNKITSEATFSSLRVEMEAYKQALLEAKTSTSATYQEKQDALKLLEEYRLKELRANLQIEQYQKDQTRLESELSDMKEKLQEKKDELSNAVQMYSRSQDFHSSNLSEMRAQKTELEVKLNLLQAERIDLTSQLSNNSEQVLSLTRDLERETQKALSADKNLERVSAEFEQARTDLAASKQSLAASEGRTSSLETELKTSRQKWEEKHAKSTAEAAKAKQEYTESLSALQTKTALIEKELQTVQQEKATLAASEKTLLQQVSQLNTDLAHKSSELESFKKITGASENVALNNVVQLDMEVARLRMEAGARGVLSEQLQVAQKLVTELQKQVYEGEMERRKLHNTIQDLKGNVRVVVRVRPFMSFEEQEKEEGSPFDTNSLEGNKMWMLNEKKQRGQPYAFDRVFGPTHGQQNVFDEVSPLVQSALDGYNVCLFSYGQTGSGKTWTMQGGDGLQDQGIIPRSIAKVMETAKHLEAQGWSYTMHCSFLEIYNETLKDLLSDNDDNQVDIKLDRAGVPSVQGLEKVEVTRAEQISKIMAKASKARSVARTEMNARSSRSHAVFTLHLQGNNKQEGVSITGALNLCDLAGSERLSRSGAVGQQLKETQAINKSLSCLGDVFMALSSKTSHVPFRNSKLTFLLQPCFGKNGKTLMIVNLSPTVASKHESSCSLRFAATVNQTELGRASKQISRIKGDSSDNVTTIHPSATPAGQTNKKRKLDIAAAVSNTSSTASSANSAKKIKYKVK